MNIQGLIDAGFLRPGSFATYYDCDECCETGEVTWRDNVKDGGQYACYRCECGLNSVEPEELFTWNIVVPILVQRIGESLGGTPPFRETIPEIVWALGRKMRHEFYYVRRMNRREVTVIKTFFEQYPKAVLVTPTNLLQKQLKEVLPNHICFSIETIGTLDDACRLSIDMKLIEAELEPVEDKPKRQRMKRGNRAANIEKLITEMKEHFRASKDYYYATQSLLPRLTQAELAKRVGIRQNEVSRCLADPDATALKFLWEHSDDIRSVLNS
ncbi:MAG: hypothetical protein LBJ67_07060 [Planctomycetaceae bacterium]|jgi:hypothetical protein|nr:hypothetical protein [Planctomycetaceae bacterium]